MNRIVVATLWIGGIVAATIGLAVSWQRPVLAAAGLALGALLAWAWRERMRPRSNIGWWLLGITTLLLATFSPTWSALPVGGIVAALSMLDDRRSPGGVLAGGLLLTTWRGGRYVAGDVEAWWIASGALLIVIAAVLERERLARPTGLGATLGWNLGRMTFLAAWTLTFLLLQGSIHPAQWLPAQIIDPGRTSGRVFLAATMVAAMLGAAVLWGRGRRSAPSS